MITISNGILTGMKWNSECTCFVQIVLDTLDTKINEKKGVNISSFYLSLYCFFKSH